MLTQNPRASVIQENGGNRVFIFAPVPGKGLQRTVIDRRTQPELAETLLGTKRHELSEDDYAALLRMGVLLDEAAVPAVVLFRPMLPEVRPERISEPNDWIVNPELTLGTPTSFETARTTDHGPTVEWCEKPLAEHPRRFSDPVLPASSFVLVPSPVGGGTALFVLDPEQLAILEELNAGHLAPRELPQRIFIQLKSTDILVHTTAREQRPPTPIDLKSTGYHTISGLWNSTYIDEVNKYFKNLISQGYMTFGDPLSQRHITHNDPVARHMHSSMTEHISKLTGRRLKPSYVYFGGYRNGSTLNPHLDRPQCEISVSLLLGFSLNGEPTHRSSWPLEFRTHPMSEPSQVYQHVGDCTIYLGCDVYHGRPPLLGGAESNSLFMHYVPEEFNGDLS